MFAFYFIGKRALFDILRTSVFWVALILLSAIIFSILFWGWHAIESGEDHQPRRGMHNDFDPDPDISVSPEDLFRPEVILLWTIYGFTIGFANLLAVFSMMGLLGRELDRKTIDMLISRPVTRGHIFFGKLLAGWASIFIFMLFITLWTLLSMQIGGMGIELDYVKACAIGLLSPMIIGAITLVLSMWMWGYVSGLLSMIITFTSGTIGLWMLKWIGVELLKFDLAVKIIIRALPPMSVIGQTATENIDSQLWTNMVKGIGNDSLLPGPADGLYTEMWQVFAYLGIVLLAGWLSFFRRQFN